MTSNACFSKAHTFSEFIIASPYTLHLNIVQLKLFYGVTSSTLFFVNVVHILLNIYGLFLRFQLVHLGPLSN